MDNFAIMILFSALILAFILPPIGFPLLLVVIFMSGLGD